MMWCAEMLLWCIFQKFFFLLHWMNTWISYDKLGILKRDFIWIVSFLLILIFSFFSYVWRNVLRISSMVFISFRSLHEQILYRILWSFLKFMLLIFGNVWGWQTCYKKTFDLLSKFNVMLEKQTINNDVQ